MNKTMLVAVALLTSGLACTGAQAGGVYWSLGINAPLDGVGAVGTVIGNYPRQPALVVQAPRYDVYPVYQPAYQAPPVVYYPAPVQLEYQRYAPYHPRRDERGYRRSHERRGEWRDREDGDD